VLHVRLTEGVELVSSIIGVFCNANVMGKRGNSDQNTYKNKKQRIAIRLEEELEVIRDHWEDQDVGGWTIFKWILER
jgi:hypothetical protein